MTQMVSERKILSMSKALTLEEFLDGYPDGYGRFELHRGTVCEMQAPGNHEQVAGKIAAEFIL